MKTRKDLATMNNQQRRISSSSVLTMRKGEREKKKKERVNELARAVLLCFG